MQEKKFDIKKLEKIPKEKCFICKNQINKEDIVFDKKFKWQSSKFKSGSNIKI